MHTKKKRNTSIATKISFVLLAMVVVSTSAIGVFGWYLHRTDSINLNARTALGIAESTAAMIDGDAFAKIMQTLQKDEYYGGVKAALDEIKTRTKVEYLYVLGSEYSDTTIYFAEGYDAARDETAFDLGERESIEVYPEEMFTALRTGDSMITQVYKSGDYGMMVTGVAPVLDSKGSVVGVVGADVSLEDVLMASTSFGVRIILIVVLCIALFSALSVLIMRWMIGRPIQALTAASEKIAAGDLNIDVRVGSNDEIGRLASAFQSMIDSTRHQTEVLQALSDGDLTVNVEPRCDNDTMSFTMAGMIERLKDIFGNIAVSAAQVSSASEQMAISSQSLSSGASEQASSMEDLQTIVESVSERTNDNALMAGEAVNLVRAIKESAEEGARQMQSMLSAVHEINEANHSIHGVLRAIDDIASQTNLLAINAAVEAAHAGQFGASFAVVAGEVRTLAARSAESARETAALIEDSIEKTELGVRIAAETQASFERIVSGIIKSGKLIDGMAGVSVEQSGAIEQIRVSVGEITNVIRQNSATAQESAAASQEMNGQALMLKSSLNQFHLQAQIE